jgi:AcrR family transcriptional regulator
MPVPKGGSIDPAATRARILDAATELFYQRGVHAVGVSDVAAAAGASKLSLYRYFPSKQDLVAAVLAERSRQVHNWLSRETRNAPSGPDRVLAVFDLLSDWYRQANFRGCAIVNVATDTRGDNDSRVTALSRGYLQRYRNLLEERLAQIEPRPADPARLGRQLLLLIEGATTIAAIDDPNHAGPDARAAAATLIAAAPVTAPTAGATPTSRRREARVASPSAAESAPRR